MLFANIHYEIKQKREKTMETANKQNNETGNASYC